MTLLWCCITLLWHWHDIALTLYETVLPLTWHCFDTVWHCFDTAWNSMTLLWHCMTLLWHCPTLPCLEQYSLSSFQWKKLFRLIVRLVVVQSSQHCSLCWLQWKKWSRWTMSLQSSVANCRQGHHPCWKPKPAKQLEQVWGCFLGWVDGGVVHSCCFLLGSCLYSCMLILTSTVVSKVH